jgi:hypothetical protein
MISQPETMKKCTNTEEEVESKDGKLDAAEAELAQAKAKASDMKRRCLHIDDILCSAEAKVSAKTETLSVLQVRLPPRTKYSTVLLQNTCCA